jgi:CheY-like chemotaxis protein
MGIHSYQPILLIEDSPEDFHAAMRAFQKAGLANPIILCEDGDEALEYLFCRGRFAPPADAPLPGIILLDLNLPGTDGHEVLDAVKKNSRLQKIPVIVLTTSCEAMDIDRCFLEGASSYICKPVDLGGLMNAIRGLKECRFESTVFSKE